MNEPTVTDAMARLGSLAGYGLDIHPERCVRVRNRHASCRRCADACTSGALSFGEGELLVSQQLCVGCGTCATVCPTCALEACHPNDADLLTRADAALAAQRAGAAHAVCSEEEVCDETCVGAAPADAVAQRGAGAIPCVTFACGEAVRRDPAACAQAGAIELICLSRIDESLAVELFARGAQRVRLVHGACEGCPRAAGIRSAHLVRDTVDAIAQVWGFAERLELVDVGALGDASSAPQVSSAPQAERPSLDEYLRIPGQTTAASSSVDPDSAPAEGAHVVASGDTVRATYRPVHVGADGTLPHFVPLRRHRLLDALDCLGAPADATLDTRLWGHVRINEDLCQSCKMCAVFCPTGALQKFTDPDGRTGVEHYVAECVHCGLCQDICPAHAIVSETRVPARQLADGDTERYDMPDPVWWTGPDQILRRMRPQITGNDVRHSY